MGSYYGHFIKSYSDRMRPLIDLTKKGKVFNWTTKYQEALDDLKKTLTGPNNMTFLKWMVSIYLIVMLVMLEFQE